VASPITGATLAPAWDTVKSLYNSIVAVAIGFDWQSAVLRDLMQPREKICHVHAIF
jgi:hypothetical protein